MFYRQFIPLLIGLLAMLAHCAQLGEASVTFSDQNLVPTQTVVDGQIKPGMGADGGPATYAFWAKSRQATSDAMIGSFAPFYKVNATLLATSTHYVLYRDILGPYTMDATAASSVLSTLEAAYDNLKAIYGAGQQPYTNGSARIVILAYDILDDYATTNNYVGGYFAPRDLYANNFTTALYTDPIAIQQYSNLIGTLGGYSNEMSIINYDLSPGYSLNPSQVNDTVTHELSHLFTYSTRVIKDRLTNHDLWIAEGIAENAPDVAPVAPTQSVEALRFTQLASPSMIDYYQSAPQLTDFLTWGPKVVGYIQSNLFFNYLRHRAELVAAGSSTTLLTELMTVSDQTIAGVDTIIQKYISTANFSTLYGDYVITNYLMLLGIPIDATSGLNGAAASQTQYSLDQVKIGSSSSTINVPAGNPAYLTKYPAIIPYNYEGTKCADGSYGLKPNSYIIFRHQFDGGDKITTNTAGSDSVAGELPLKYVLNLRTENQMISATPPTTITLATFDAGQTLPLTSYGLTVSDVIHIIIYNPNKTGGCRQFNPASPLILQRNHSKWVGYNSYATHAAPDFDWQSAVGAVWTTSQNGGYYRPGGIAADISAYPNNFLYVADYTNMSLQKLNLDTGTAVGRLGNTSSTCPTSGIGWDTSNTRYANGFCAHDFDSPQGVHIDTAHNIYIADSNNRRIVKYDSSGNFVGWIGLNGVGNDVWQNASTVTSGNTLFTAGADKDPRMFLLPWTLVSDATYLYIVDNGAHRISRRNKTSGVFSAYIGNGNNAWNSATTNQSGTSGNTAGYFNSPRWLAISGSNIYAVDEFNHRIVRIDLASGAATGWLGAGGSTWQGMATLPSGTGSGNNQFFKNPSAIATDDTNLYIADRLNNRIVNWSIAGVYNGWVGWGKVGWEKTAAAPTTDPYAGVSYYPPDYYAEPQGLAIATQANKGTRNDYLFVTSIYNGRVTRINLSCVNAPNGTGCVPIYTFP